MIYLYKQYIDPKLRLLELVEDLGNVTEACKIMGYSRDSYYRFKALFNEGGEEALLALTSNSPRRKKICDNIEEAVLKLTLEMPTLGQVRISKILSIQGVSISAGGVRNIWLRNGLETAEKRLDFLAKAVESGAIVPTKEQLRQLESFGTDESEVNDEIKSEYPGHFLSQDTYFVGTISGVGSVYQQTVIDVYSRMAFGRLYLEKSSEMALDLLEKRVAPWFQHHGIEVENILTDRGKEYGGRNSAENLYRQFLLNRGILHQRSQGKNPQANSQCEEFHARIKSEVYDNILCRYPDLTLETLRNIVSRWLKEYNEHRSNDNGCCKGKTPCQTFAAGKIMALVKQDPEFREIG